MTALDSYLVGIFWAFHLYAADTDQQLTQGGKLGILHDASKSDDRRASRGEFYGLAAGAVRSSVEFEFSQCARCRAPIGHRSPAGLWLHLDGSRGCRAATFTVEAGWDDTLPKSWTAKPSAATRRD